MRNKLFPQGIGVVKMMREGRLGKIDSEAARYASSLEFDKNIFEYDVIGSMAHAVMLCERKIIGTKDASKILKGLGKIMSGGVEKLKLAPENEDIHMGIEELLIKNAGKAGGSLHTARSRNDQIACDLRMLVRDEVNETILRACNLVKELVEKSSKNTATLMPGYTHLQRAQPTTLAHHLLAHSDALLRDVERLEDAYKRINLSPLGACALGTTSFAISRARTKELLGFDGLVENSADAVSSRDFVLEALSVLALLMVDMSRLAEELILWSAEEFGFVEISNELSSTSSIMPQKKNPDCMEIARAKAGIVIGNLASALAITKALPYTYNRDFQELSPLALSSFNAAKDSASMMSKVIRTASFNREKMLGADFTAATEIADLLVRESGVPFRTAHGIVGTAVAEAIRKGLRNVDGKLINEAAKKILGRRLNISEEKIKKASSPAGAVASRKVIGGPSPTQVKRMLAERRKMLLNKKAQSKQRAEKIKAARKRLFDAVYRLTRGQE